MKIARNSLLTVLLLWLASAVPFLGAEPLGTAFSYQGRLDDNGLPANGVYDFKFSLFDSATNGTQVGENVTNLDTTLTDGAFAVVLDFGNSPFQGEARWLEIEVRTNGMGEFTLLHPRQPLLAAPYALYAPVAGSAAVASSLAGGTYLGSIHFSNAANVFVGDGTGLRGVDASTLGGLSSGTFWQTSGNAGTDPTNHFLGTTDDQPFEIRVNGQCAVRFEPTEGGYPNLILGASNEVVQPLYWDLVGTTISGGAANRVVSADFNTIGGGRGNTIFAETGDCTISGGMSNYISVIDFPGGGCTIGGGKENRMYYSLGAAVGGGFENIIDSQDGSVIGGGYRNQVGDWEAGYEYRLFGTIAGGAYNYVRQDYGTIGGGRYNSIIDDLWSWPSDHGTIGGGLSNLVDGVCGTIPGGFNNQATNYAFAAGRSAKARHVGSFVWADSTQADFGSTAYNQFLIRASGGVGIGTDSPVSTLHVNGVITANTFNHCSDRDAKENRAPVASRDILEKVAGLRIESWNFKADPDVRHLGPMAQDFYAAFELGSDDKHIASVDADGVALSAIQALNAAVQEKEARIERLEREVSRLEEQLNSLLDLVKSGTPGY